jgi:hypothetical protein
LPFAILNSSQRTPECSEFPDQDTRENAIESLYLDALAPISDEFTRLEIFWKRKRDFEFLAGRKNRAMSPAVAYDGWKARQVSELSTLRDILAERENSPGRNTEVVAQLTGERAALEAYSSRFGSARNLDERTALSIELGS